MLGKKENKLIYFISINVRFIFNFSWRKQYIANFLLKVWFDWTFSWRWICSFYLKTKQDKTFFRVTSLLVHSNQSRHLPVDKCMFPSSDDFSSWNMMESCCPSISTVREKKKALAFSFLHLPQDEVTFFFFTSIGNHCNGSHKPVFFYFTLAHLWVSNQGSAHGLRVEISHIFPGTHFLLGNNFGHHTNKSACPLLPGVKVWVAYIRKEHIDNSGAQLQNAILKRFF